MRWYLGPLILAMAACGPGEKVDSRATEPAGEAEATAVPRAAEPPSATAEAPPDDTATAPAAGLEPSTEVPISFRARVVGVDAAGKTVTLAETDAPAGATPREVAVEAEAMNEIATLSQGDEVMATCRTAVGATRSQPAGLPDCMAVVSLADAGPMPETVPGG